MLDWTETAGFVGAALAGAAYVPQITHLLHERCSAGISQFAFNAWLAASLLVMTRAVAIHAGVFIVLGAIQVVATAVICVATRVYADSYCVSHEPGLPRAGGPSTGTPASTARAASGMAS